MVTPVILHHEMVELHLCKEFLNKQLNNIEKCIPLGHYMTWPGVESTLFCNPLNSVTGSELSTQLFAIPSGSCKVEFLGTDYSVRDVIGSNRLGNEVEKGPHIANTRVLSGY